MATELAIRSIPDICNFTSGRQRLKPPGCQAQLLTLPPSLCCFRRKFPLLMKNRNIVHGEGQLRAVKEEQLQASTAHTQVSETDPAASKLVLVLGGTGGVGQLVVASLLNRNIKLRLLLRDPLKATTLFGNQYENLLQVWKGDTRNDNDIDPAIFEESCFIGRYPCNLLHWNYSISFKALGWR